MVGAADGIGQNLLIKALSWKSIWTASRSKSRQKSKNLKGHRLSFLTSDTRLHSLYKDGFQPYETHDGELPAVVEPLEHGSRSSLIIPPAVHGYEELELPLGLLGLQRTFYHLVWVVGGWLVKKFTIELVFEEN